MSVLPLAIIDFAVSGLGRGHFDKTGKNYIPDAHKKKGVELLAGHKDEMVALQEQIVKEYRERSTKGVTIRNFASATEEDISAGYADFAQNRDASKCRIMPLDVGGVELRFGEDDDPVRLLLHDDPPFGLFNCVLVETPEYFANNAALFEKFARENEYRVVVMTADTKEVLHDEVFGILNPPEFASARKLSIDLNKAKGQEILIMCAATKSAGPLGYVRGRVIRVTTPSTSPAGKVTSNKDVFERPVVSLKEALDKLGDWYKPLSAKS